jgi:hypothetical protein
VRPVVVEMLAHDERSQCEREEHQCGHDLHIGSPTPRS